jgi:hypothetical protein
MTERRMKYDGDTVSPPGRQSKLELVEGVGEISYKDVTAEVDMTATTW